MLTVTKIKANKKSLIAKIIITVLFLALLTVTSIVFGKDYYRQISYPKYIGGVIFDYTVGIKYAVLILLCFVAEIFVYTGALYFICNNKQKYILPSILKGISFLASLLVVVAYFVAVFSRSIESYSTFSRDFFSLPYVAALIAVGICFLIEFLAFFFNSEIKEVFPKKINKKKLVAQIISIILITVLAVVTAVLLKNDYPRQEEIINPPSADIFQISFIEEKYAALTLPCFIAHFFFCGDSSTYSAQKIANARFFRC